MSLRAPAVALAIFALGSSPARADDRARATELVQKGSEQFSAGDFASALRSFQLAYQAYASPKVLFNIGRAAAELHHEVTAANAFNGFVDQTNDAPQIRTQLNFAREQVDKRKAKLGLFIFQVVPLEAAVTVDGERTFDSNWYVAPGIHAMKVTAPGYAAFEDHFDIHATERRTVPVVLQKPLAVNAPAAHAPPPVLAPTVASAPAVPAVAGLDRGTAAPASSARRAAGWTLVGCGAGAVAISAVFGALAASQNSTLDALVSGKPSSAVPSDAASLRSSIKTDAWVSTATLGVGLTAAAVGAYLLLTHPAEVLAPAADTRGAPAVSYRF